MEVKIQLNKLQQRKLRKISRKAIYFDRNKRISCAQMGYPDQKSCLLNPGVITALRSWIMRRSTRKALQLLFDMKPLETYLWNAVEFVDRNDHHIFWLCLTYGNSNQYGFGINRLVYWSFED